MTWFSVWFIRTSIVYLAIASVLGVVMEISPDRVETLRFIHVHLNLIGFMSMMIFGVGYHIFPRFSGRPLWSASLAQVQFWTSQIGLAGMCLSYGFLGTGTALIFFSILEVLSIFLFLLNMLKTVKGLP